MWGDGGRAAMVSDLPPGHTLAYDPWRRRWYLRAAGEVVADVPRGHRRVLVQWAWKRWAARADRHAHASEV
jgi:hypothetical protein